MANNVEEELELVPILVKPTEDPGGTTVNENNFTTELMPIHRDEEINIEVINDTSDNTTSQPCRSNSTPIPIEGKTNYISFRNTLNSNFKLSRILINISSTLRFCLISQENVQAVVV